MSFAAENLVLVLDSFADRLVLGNFVAHPGNIRGLDPGRLLHVLHHVRVLGHGLGTLADGTQTMPVAGRWAVAGIGAVLDMRALECERRRWFGVGSLVGLAGSRQEGVWYFSAGPHRQVLPFAC